MVFHNLELSGAYLIEPELHEDDRGFFSRIWCKEKFSKICETTQIYQINNSYNKKRGTLRGLHFQKPPNSEVKIVRCTKGSIWDVIVDIRVDSLTYGKWFGAELSSDNRLMMYVPKGFAHGLISLTDDSELIYFVSEPYTPESEGAIRWDDPFHGIQWPIDPIFISEKDRLIKDWSPDT